MQAMVLEDSKVVISTSEYSELVRAAEKIAAVKRVIWGDKYPSTSIIKAILEIEDGEDNVQN